MSNTNPASSIPVPEIDSDTPVDAIPVASVAPLDGPADGERINTFTLAPRDGRLLEEVLGEARDRVLSKPLSCLAAAFAFGLVIGRVLR
jgi:hypothetical protein